MRAATDDVVIQHSTGGTGVPLERRLEPLRTDPASEMASLDTGSVNRYRHLTGENPRATVDALFAEMRERGIKPEMEAFDPGPLNEVYDLLERAEVDDPPYLNVLRSGGTLTVPRPRNLLDLVENSPDKSVFNTLATGRHQLPLTTRGILLGGHVRVGFEDDLHYRRDERAESNARLVDRTREIARLLGRPVATPGEAREILGL